MSGRGSEYRDVVRKGRLGVRVFLVAGEPPCIELRDRIARPKGRDYRTKLLGDLEAVEVPARWVMAVVLCPGDTTELLVRWMERYEADSERVLFVLHPDVDAVVALTAWYAAGYPDPVVVEARTFNDCAKVIGRFVNDWIYREEKGSGWAL